jgi:nucleotide-binding universal stress UspA family protein
MPADIEKEITEVPKNKMADRIGPEKDTEIVVLSGHPGRTITVYAREILADCIIVGSHRPEIKDFFLGSTAARIMRYAPCSVHVLR